METAVMSSVQSDNFKFVRHMIMSGWTYLQANDSTFSVSINRLGADRQVQEDWHVSNASPLHFAISCGSLNAAAALLVAFPELSTTVCRVEIESELESKSTFALWTPLELASFFADLYCAVDTPRYLAYHQVLATRALCSCKLRACLTLRFLWQRRLRKCCTRSSASLPASPSSTSPRPPSGSSRQAPT
eukprot:1685021-Rhodomonas_salina.2